MMAQWWCPRSPRSCFNIAPSQGLFLTTVKLSVTKYFSSVSILWTSRFAWLSRRAVTARFVSQPVFRLSLSTLRIYGLQCALTGLSSRILSRKSAMKFGWKYASGSLSVAGSGISSISGSFICDGGWWFGGGVWRDDDVVCGGGEARFGGVGSRDDCRIFCIVIFISSGTSSSSSSSRTCSSSYAELGGGGKLAS